MNKKLKIQVVLASTLLLALLVATFAPSPAWAAGWQQSAEGDWYFQNNDGTYVTNNWVAYNGTYYFFGADGKLVTDSFVTKTHSYFGMELEKETYYVGPDGKPRADYLLTKDGETYYFGPDGIMIKNETITYEGNTYSFDSEGKCVRSSNKSTSAYAKQKTSLASDVMSGIIVTAMLIGLVWLLINPSTRRPTLVVLAVILTLGIALALDGMRSGSNRR